MDEILCSRCGNSWEREYVTENVKEFCFKRMQGGTFVQIMKCPHPKCGRAGFLGETPAYERLTRNGIHTNCFYMIPPPGADIEYKRS